MLVYDNKPKKITKGLTEIVIFNVFNPPQWWACLWECGLGGKGGAPILIFGRGNESRIVRDSDTIIQLIYCEY